MSGMPMASIGQIDVNPMRVPTQKRIHFCSPTSERPEYPQPNPGRHPHCQTYLQVYTPAESRPKAQPTVKRTRRRAGSSENHKSPLR